MAKFYFVQFAETWEEYLPVDQACKCFVFVDDDTGKELASASELGVSGGWLKHYGNITVSIACLPVLDISRFPRIAR